MLMHHTNAQGRGIVGVLDGHWFSILADLSSIWLIHPKEDRHQRRLPCAVFPQQRMDLPFPQLECDVVIGPNSRKLLGDVKHLNHILRSILHAVTYFPLFSRPRYGHDSQSIIMAVTKSCKIPHQFIGTNCRKYLSPPPNKAICLPLSLFDRLPLPFSPL